ncbi:MAG: hypothetical protein PHW76_08565, partial [Alphaproteobacteria bacterium]|nr:hypothetical protein [Alphaproteobacteria bacterium]
AIGNLDSQASVITISEAGENAATSVTATFKVTTGGITSLSSTISNVVTAACATFQLLDSDGNVVASNDTSATAAQQSAYAEWLDGSLVLDAGTYTATATAGNGALLSISSQERQGTSIEIDSQLTGSDATEYYTLSFAGANIKLDMDSEKISNMRILLYDNTGAVVADSNGDAVQQQSYIDLTSNKGLSADAGDYTLEITYADGADATQAINYTATLYSGDYYGVVYKNAVTAQAYDDSASGSVTAASDAELYTSTKYNKIYTSAADAINIGWMKQDESMLDVYSMLTAADNTDYYKFTFQEGDALKFDFNKTTTTDTSGIRVQLLDRTGTRVIADSHGTDDQKDAYKELTSSTGLKADTGQYIVKVSYVDGADREDTAYEFGLYSGTTYVAKYKTTASPQTFANAMLAGEMSVKSTQVSIASYLQAAGTDSDESLVTALKSFA